MLSDSERNSAITAMTNDMAPWILDSVNSWDSEQLTGDSMLFEGIRAITVSDGMNALASIRNCSDSKTRWTSGWMWILCARSQVSIIFNFIFSANHRHENEQIHQLALTKLLWVRHGFLLRMICSALTACIFFYLHHTLTYHGIRNLDPLTETVSIVYAWLTILWQYNLSFYLSYLARWPDFFSVAESFDGKMMGYGMSWCCDIDCHRYFYKFQLWVKQKDLDRNGTDMSPR